MPPCLSTGWTVPASGSRILVNEAARIERSEFLGAKPHERTASRRDSASGFKPQTMFTRLGEVTFQVPQVRFGEFYPSALEKGTRTDQVVNLALAEMYVQGVSTRRLNRGPATAARTGDCAVLRPGEPRRPKARRRACDLARAPVGRGALPVAFLLATRRCAWKAESSIAPCSSPSASTPRASAGCWAATSPPRRPRQKSAVSWKASWPVD